MTATGLLLLETSLQGVSAGFVPLVGPKAGELVWSGSYTEPGQSAAKLPQLIETALEQHNTSIENIGGMVIALGPGSFTGLRIGMAYAFGLAVGIEGLTGKRPKWLGYSSLDILQRRYAKNQLPNRFLLVLPATKTSGYACVTSQQNSPEFITIEFSTDQGQKATMELIERHQQIMSIGAWSDFQAISAKPVQVLGLKEAVAESLMSIAHLAAKAWPDGFSDQMPLLQYLKKSTVEEKAELSRLNAGKVIS